VAIIERPRERAAPLLGEILRAALDRTHLRVVYDALSGRSERLIFPFKLYALTGFWYCACYDYTRETNLALRADRFVSLAREAGPAPPHIPVAAWPDIIERADGPGLPLRVAVNSRGMRRGDLPALFGRLRSDWDGGGVLEGTIPQSEIDFYAALLLSAGPMCGWNRRPNSSRPSAARSTRSSPCTSANRAPVTRHQTCR